MDPDHLYLTVDHTNARCATLYPSQPRRIRLASPSNAADCRIDNISRFWSRDTLVVDYSNIRLHTALFMLYSAAENANISINLVERDSDVEKFIIPSPDPLHQRRLSNIAAFRSEILEEAFYGYTTYAANCRASVTALTIAPCANWPGVKSLLPAIANSPHILPNLTSLTIDYTTKDSSLRDTPIPHFPPTVRNITIHGPPDYAALALQRSPFVKSLSIFTSLSTTSLYSTSITSYIDYNETTSIIDHHFPSLESLTISNIRARINFARYPMLSSVEAVTDPFLSTDEVFAIYTNWLKSSPALQRNSAEIPSFVVDACKRDPALVSHLRHALPTIAPESKLKKLLDNLNAGVTSSLILEITNSMIKL